jgi:hypothetical protein
MGMARLCLGSGAELRLLNGDRSLLIESFCHTMDRSVKPQPGLSGSVVVCEAGQEIISRLHTGDYPENKVF